MTRMLAAGLAALLCGAGSALAAETSGVCPHVCGARGSGVLYCVACRREGLLECYDGARADSLWLGTVLSVTGTQPSAELELA